LFLFLQELPGKDEPPRAASREQHRKFDRALQSFEVESFEVEK